MTRHRTLQLLKIILIKFNSLVIHKTYIKLISLLKIAICFSCKIRTLYLFFVNITVNDF